MDRERSNPEEVPPKESRESKPTPAYENPKPGDLAGEPERWREQP